MAKEGKPKKIDKLRKLQEKLRAKAAKKREIVKHGKKKKGKTPGW